MDLSTCRKWWNIFRVCFMFQPLCKFFFMLISQVLNCWNELERKKMRIVLFADFIATNHGLNQAQYVLKQLCDQGHHISLFGKLKILKLFLVAPLVIWKKIFERESLFFWNVQLCIEIIRFPGEPPIFGQNPKQLVARFVFHFQILNTLSNGFYFLKCCQFRFWSYCFCYLYFLEAVVSDVHFTLSSITNWTFELQIGFLIRAWSFIVRW